MDTRPQSQNPSPLSRRAVAVTPSNTDDLPVNATRGLYIGVSGDVKADAMESGSAIVFKSVPIGFFGVAVRRVYATGTTATDIVALS